MTGLSRRSFVKASASGVGGLLALQYSTVAAAQENSPVARYNRTEDVYRQKWTWDRVARGTHGTNCAGNCAFNVYVKNGVVWREEQQGEYGASSPDTPDYGPRGCQKGLRHAAYMYGKQRVLYPMRRIGKRGEPGDKEKRGRGEWERITWDEATREIAQQFLKFSIEDGPQTISLGSGTQLSVKLASFGALNRFANITGTTVPEFFSGVGDLPTGAYMTLGKVYTADTMASVYKSKCCLIWMSNPAVTRIPDAHFFWEAKYNGTEVITIAPEFNPSAMHSSLWVNPKPGTDTALAMGMVDTIISEGLYDAEYVKEYSDLPLLVRKDGDAVDEDGNPKWKYLRATDLSFVDMLAVKDNVYYMWDEATQSVVQAPGTGMAEAPPTRDRVKYEKIALGDIKPALEGSWTVDSLDGEIEITTVFELIKQRASAHSPEAVEEVTGVHPSVTRRVAREVAKASGKTTIYSGYAACKSLHGDMLQRAMLLILTLTHNVGPEGTGLQFSNSPKSRGMLAFAFAGVGPATRIISSTQWDYEHGKMKEINEQIYGKELADKFDRDYFESVDQRYFPDYGKKGWKMGFFAGNNGANWRASGDRWRQTAFGNLEYIVTMTPDMSATAYNSDIVLPIAHHYERADIMMQSRTPYVHILDRAVPPLGEAVDDFTAFKRISKAITEVAEEEGIGAFQDEVDGNTIRRDPKRYYELYTMEGRIEDVRDIVQFIINSTPGIPKIPFKEMATKGIVRVDGSDTTQWATDDSPYHSEIVQSYLDKKPFETFTSRIQFYIDHEWFLRDDEQLPKHIDLLKNKRKDGEGHYPLRMMMGHARHGIHSMWRDDPLMVSLQRGEPDIYIHPEDAKARGVEDGDKIKVFNDFGNFYVQAHLTEAMQPGMMFMYHGWDPMMFDNQRNFSDVISTAGLLKPTTMAGDWGHLGHRPLAFAPNQTYKDFTCDFEKVDPRELQGASPA